MKRNIFISLQKGFLTLMSAALLFSCSSIEPFDASELVESQESIAVQFKSTDLNARVGLGYEACAGSEFTTKLMAGQHIPVGEVTIFNTGDDFYVTVSIEKGGEFSNDDWFIKKLNIFTGKVQDDFATKGKSKIVNPNPNKFPAVDVAIDYTKESVKQEYTHKLPITQAMKDAGEFDISVFAEVVRVEDINYEAGTANEKETEGAWAKGERFNSDGKGHWGMFVSYTIKPCSPADVCNADWTRWIEFNGNKIESGDTTQVGGNVDLVAKYTINGDNGGRVGYAILQRERSPTSNNGIKFTATFVPDAGYQFKNMELCIDTNNEFNSEGIKCKTSTHASGYTIVLENVPFNTIPTGQGQSVNYQNFARVFVESNACDI